jgi:predicted SnoaL-like aldol condensation-catalyzing enzyme
MSTTLAEKNRSLVLEAFDTLFNQRAYEKAAAYWSPDYIQHSAYIASGREGLFELAKGLPPAARYENAVAIAQGDYVILHGRFSGTGLLRNWIVADIVLMKDGILIEHWDVIQDKATESESKSRRPMFKNLFAPESSAADANGMTS